MTSLRNILILLLVSCGGGSNNSPTLLIEIPPDPQTFSYNPPSGNSRDNCVAKSDSANWIDDFNTTELDETKCCLLYTSPSPRDATLSRMPSSA